MLLGQQLKLIISVRNIKLNQELLLMIRFTYENATIFIVKKKEFDAGNLAEETARIGITCTDDEGGDAREPISKQTCEFFFTYF